MAVCIECGTRSRKPLYQTFGGNIQLNSCGHCGHIIDKYIECEGLIICLDLMLHRLQVMRHLLFNYHITTFYSFVMLIMVLLATSYSKLLSYDLVCSFHWIDKQYYFYMFLFHSIIEYGLQLNLFILLIHCIGRFTSHLEFSVHRLGAKSLLLGSYAAMFVIPATVWSSTWKGIYLHLPWLLVMTSHVQILRALTRSNLVVATVSIATMNYSIHVIGYYISIGMNHLFSMQLYQSDSLLHILTENLLNFKIV